MLSVNNITSSLSCRLSRTGIRSYNAFFRARKTFKSVYYIADHVKALSDQISLPSNPNGYIDFTVAENNLCWPLMREKMMVSQTYPEGISNYTLSRGLPEFLETMAGFIKDRYSHHPVSMNEVAVLAGSASAINTIMFTLCDDGDAMLCIMNYYTLLLLYF